ncbi:hypothetical protein MKS77_18810 [Acinetobacter baumannii]
MTFLVQLSVVQLVLLFDVVLISFCLFAFSRQFPAERLFCVGSFGASGTVCSFGELSLLVPFYFLSGFYGIL